MPSDMFMKIDDIEGESVDASHKDQIEVLAWSWVTTQKGSAHSGTGAGAGKVNVGDLSFTKYVDRSSPLLFKLCCNGKHF
jgi:type VI secretion system secreted protein Hcp